MDLSLSGQSRDAGGRRPAARPGLGPWVGARGASPRCPILRPGSSNLLRSTSTRQFTAGSLPTLLQLSDSGSRPRGPRSRLANPHLFPQPDFHRKISARSHGTPSPPPTLRRPVHARHRFLLKTPGAEESLEGRAPFT